MATVLDLINQFGGLLAPTNNTPLPIGTGTPIMPERKSGIENPWTHIGLGLLGGWNGMQSYTNMMGARQEKELRKARLEAEQRALEQAEDDRKRMQSARERLAEKFPDIAPVLEAYPSAASQVLGAQYRAPTEAPSNVREWQYFNALTPEQRRQYLAMKRAGQVVDRGSEYVVLDPMAGYSPQAVVTKDLPPEQQPAVKGAQAEESAAGQARGKAGAEAAIGLGQALAEAQNAISVIDQMIAHPGLGYAVGTSSILPIVPGTAAADFDALAKQLEGKAFLQAFETLKGGGQITEMEGQKATAAMARLSRAQTETEYKSSLRELKNILQAGMLRTKAKAKQPQGMANGASDGWSIRLVE